ncbi:MAG: hypothetical protein RI883_2120, partial [Bacteroidota bacterium]
AVDGETFTVTGTDANGCVNTVQTTITINPLPVVTATNSGSYCQGDVVADIMVDVTGTANWTVNYTLNGTAQTAVLGSTSPISLGNTAGIYILTGISDANCTNTASGTQTIIINPIPSAPTAGMDTVYCSNWTVVPMTANGGNGTFTWYEDVNLTNVYGTGAAINPNDAIIGTTTYYVTETEFGCEGPASTIAITINDCEIIVPTAFTPNGDLSNDVWNIVDIDNVYPNNIVFVYNRWGNLLFESEKGNYLSRPWDGKVNGEQLPVASYYYVIYTEGDKSGEILNGIVSIIKN